MIEMTRTAHRDVSVPLDAPAWLASTPLNDPVSAAVAAGAALATLHPLGIERAIGVPHVLWRDRLALIAAEAAAIRVASRARAPDMRDQTYLLAPGQRPGPAGAALALQRSAASLPIGKQDGLSGHAALAGDLAIRCPCDCTKLASTDPVAAAAAVLESSLAEASRSERAAAVMLADATLAAALRWPYAPPLLGVGLRREDLALKGVALRLACAAALARVAHKAITLGNDLSRRAAGLRCAAAIVRAKAANDAVRLFLSQDAAAPQRDLSPIVRGGTARMSERSARRLCERLAALGGLRELTGRKTHRLYGL